MKDRTGKELMVKNHCTFCYNTIYNPSPLSLLGQEKAIGRLHPAALRLQFVRETGQEVREVIRAYGDAFLREGEWGAKCTQDREKSTTRGHFKRGVE